MEFRNIRSASQTILGGFSASEENDIEKGGQKANIGEERKYGNQIYVKTASGWKPKTKGKEGKDDDKKPALKTAKGNDIDDSHIHDDYKEKYRELRAAGKSNTDAMYELERMGNEKGKDKKSNKKDSKADDKGKKLPKNRPASQRAPEDHASEADSTTLKKFANGDHPDDLKGVASKELEARGESTKGNDWHVSEYLDAQDHEDLAYVKKLIDGGKYEAAYHVSKHLDTIVLEQIPAVHYHKMMEAGQPKPDPKKPTQPKK